MRIDELGVPRPSIPDVIAACSGNKAEFNLETFHVWPPGEQHDIEHPEQCWCCPTMEVFATNDGEFDTLVVDHKFCQ